MARSLCLLVFAAVMVGALGLAPPVPPPGTSAPASKGSAPACTWYAYSADVANAGYCRLNDPFMLAITAQPTTYIGKALTRVFGRQYECSQLGSEKACKVKSAALGCVWANNADQSLPAKSCSAQEHIEWRYFTTHPYTFAAPGWMSCPKGVTNCPAACYLKQIASIEKTATMSKADAEKACKANPYAKWVSGSCSPNLFGSDAWGKEVVMNANFCSGNSKNNKFCLESSPAGAVVNMERYTKLKNFPSPAEARAAKC